MLLLTHIFVALLGIVVATLSVIAPSQRKLNTSYGLLAATLTTGTLLVWQLHASLVSACFSGLLYTSFITISSVVAKRRLVRATARITSLE
jgi:hypothetical protein